MDLLDCVSENTPNGQAHNGSIPYNFLRPISNSQLPGNLHYAQFLNSQIQKVQLMVPVEVSLHLYRRIICYANKNEPVKNSEVDFF